jgi:hypothetical protein
MPSRCSRSRVDMGHSLWLWTADHGLEKSRARPGFFYFLLFFFAAAFFFGAAAFF